MNYVVVNIDNSEVKILSGETRLEEHFKVKELSCKDNSEVIVYSAKVLRRLELIRLDFGESITITSGFRTFTHNKKWKGSVNTNHFRGALDYRATKRTKENHKKLYQLTEKYFGWFSGIGYYNTWIHADLRFSHERWY